MNNHKNQTDLEHISMRGFSSRLLLIKGFIRRLIDFFSVTEQDLKDAGVFHP